MSLPDSCMPLGLAAFFETSLALSVDSLPKFYIEYSVTQEVFPTKMSDLKLFTALKKQQHQVKEEKDSCLTIQSAQ